MLSFLNALPGAMSQGLIWGIMAIGVYITYKILDIADLTVDGSFCTGGAVFVMLFSGGANVWAAMLAALLAGMLAGLVTGLLNTQCGIPAILAGILTQLGLYSVNMAVMDFKASVAINVTQADTLEKLLVSLRFVQGAIRGDFPLWRHPILVVGLFTVGLIALLYGFFGTELGCALRATGSNGSMARAQGIDTDFCKVLGLMISNGLVALSVALLCQYNGANEINVGRGALFDTADVVAALDSGKVYMAGVDVFDPEPCGKDHPLATHPRCVASPHVAWSPLETRQNLVDRSAENLRALLDGTPKNVMN